MIEGIRMEPRKCTLPYKMKERTLCYSDSRRDCSAVHWPRMGSFSSSRHLHSPSYSKVT